MATRMIHIRLAFLGFGNVGQALARLLLRKREELRTHYQLAFMVTGIATGRHGVAIDPHGIDLEDALAALAAGEALDGLSALPGISGASDFIAGCGANVMFECTPVNYLTGQPAVDYLRTAIEHGMHAVSANKGPVVHAYRELTALAQAKGVKYYFESAVMDGAPIFSLCRETLPAISLHAFRGILNSTTNLILTRMEAGESFDQAVAYAQAIGIAETDPSGDVDGWDAAVKVAALATVLMDVPLKPQEVDRTGIRGITPAEIARARAAGKRWKLVCSAHRQGEGVIGCVGPELVGADSSLFGVGGTSSVIQFETDVLPGLSIVETDPSPETTAYGMLADFLNAVRHAPSAGELDSGSAL
jgi:homoserine dehydrogenase